MQLFSIVINSDPTKPFVAIGDSRINVDTGCTYMICATHVFNYSKAAGVLMCYPCSVYAGRQYKVYIEGRYD